MTIIQTHHIHSHILKHLHTRISMSTYSLLLCQLFFSYTNFFNLEQFTIHFCCFCCYLIFIFFNFSSNCFFLFDIFDILSTAKNNWTTKQRVSRRRNNNIKLIIYQKWFSYNILFFVLDHSWCVLMEPDREQGLWRWL